MNVLFSREDRQITGITHETPVKDPPTLMQSTPISGPSRLPELKVSDISASEK